MKVHIPSPLYSYTGKRKLVEASGATLAELLADLERLYPGICFRMIDEQGRIREHIKIFVNQEQVHRQEVPLDPAAEIHIICAISGG